MNGWSIALGILLLAVGLVRIAMRRRGGNVVSNRDFQGNSMIGDNSGTVTQTFMIPTGKKAKADKPDYVAWVLALLGVIIATAQLGHDLLSGK